MRLSLVVIVAWLATCADTVVKAQGNAPPAIDLTWEAPSGCPQSADVVARAQAHLPSPAAAEPSLRAVARVTRDGRDYQLRHELRSGDVVARKQLAVESCEAAADAAALLIALALDPEAADARIAAPVEAEPVSQSASESNAVVAPPGEGATSKPVAAATRAASRRGKPAAPQLQIHQPSVLPGDEPLAFDFAVGVALALDLTVFPQTPAWGLRPWASVSLGRMRAAASFALFLPGQARARGVDARLEGRAVGGDVSLGFALLRTRLTLAPYVVGELLRQTIVTRGISDPDATAATWGALGIGMHAAYALGLGLRVTLDPVGLAPLLRPRWLVHASAGDVAVFSAPSLAFRLSIGLAYAFP